MKTSSETLINDLIERTMRVMNEAEKFFDLEMNELNHKADDESWSALECLEHLNRYGDFYLPEISRRIDESKYTSDEIFKTGKLGNYFALSMLPKEKLNKMNTFKSMNPNGSDLDIKTVERFIEQQKQYLHLLDKARNVSLNKTKTSISISKVLKLKLGDTFRVVIYHQERHLKQALNAIPSQAEKEKIAS